MTTPIQRPLRDNTQHSQESDNIAPGGIRTHNPTKRGAADPRQDLFLSLLPLLNYFKNKIIFLNNEGRMKVSEKISDVASFQDNVFTSHSEFLEVLKNPFGH